MDDALAMRGVERIADLDAVGNRLLHRQRSGNRLPVDELHHQVTAAVVLTDVVERADVRMIQRGDRARFPFEALGERAL